MREDIVLLLQEWRDFREQLESESDPINLAKSFFRDKPIVSFHTDPYDSSRWPEPWQLIAENIYCEFTKILAIYYSLALTAKFSNSCISIYTLRDKKNHREFPVLYIDDQCVSYQDFDILEKDLTKNNIVILSHNDMSRFLVK